MDKKENVKILPFNVAVLVTGVDCRMFNVLSIGGVLYCRSGDFELVRTLRSGDGERLNIIKPMYQS